MSLWFDLYYSKTIVCVVYNNIMLAKLMNTIFTLKKINFIDLLLMLLLL